MLNATEPGEQAQAASGRLMVLKVPPAQVGAEGVRLLHHLLLRRELGLPEARKHVSLAGQWSQ
jgi:hypothetical protein